MMMRGLVAPGLVWLRPIWVSPPELEAASCKTSCLEVQPYFFEIPILSCPCLKSKISSRPEPGEKKNLSKPGPPNSLSLPRLPNRESLPAKALMVSLFGVPRRMSFLDVPRMIAMVNLTVVCRNESGGLLALNSQTWSPALCTTDQMRRGPTEHAELI